MIFANFFDLDPRLKREDKGLVSEETVKLRRWGSDTRKFGLSTELIVEIDHRRD